MTKIPPLLLNHIYIHTICLFPFSKKKLLCIVLFFALAFPTVLSSLPAPSSSKNLADFDASSHARTDLASGENFSHFHIIFLSFGERNELWVKNLERNKLGFSSWWWSFKSFEITIYSSSFWIQFLGWMGALFLTNFMSILGLKFLINHHRSLLELYVIIVGLIGWVLMMGNSITNVYISLHSKCLIKCLVELRNWF